MSSQNLSTTLGTAKVTKGTKNSGKTEWKNQKDLSLPLILLGELSDLGGSNAYVFDLLSF
jgi:hypothetical protein